MKEQWKQHVAEVLREIGIADGHYVLDCCCGKGIYAAAAATLVGDSGRIYAIDSDSGRLKELKQEADSCRFCNIQIIEKDVESSIPLPDSSVDFVLLYDIFWYFRPTEKKTENLLREVRRVARPNAVISVFPTHVDTGSLLRFKNEMKNIGFLLVSEFSRELVHEQHLETGRLLNYRKVQHDQRERKAARRGQSSAKP